MSKRLMNQARSAGDDQVLIERARDGDQEARERIWVANRRWVAAIVLAHRPRTVDVEDLMQDVAIKFVSKLDTLRDCGAFKPWLRQITINTCRGAARKSRPTLRIAQGEQVESGEVTAPEDRHWDDQRLEHADAASSLYDRVLTLPPEYREPLLMRCVQEMSYQQIGDILDLPVTTIETRLARARRMLREESDDALKDGLA